MRNFYISNFKLLRLLKKMRPNTEIIFTARINDRKHSSLELDLDVKDVFFDL